MHHACKSPGRTRPLHDPVKKGRKCSGAYHKILNKPGFKQAKSFTAAGSLIPVAAENPMAPSYQISFSIPVKITVED